MSFLSGLLAMILGDNAKPEGGRPDTAVPRFVHWLPYRSFDPKTKIFYNSATRGFVLECTPMLGATEQSHEMLAQFLSEGIPTPGALQVHGWMSPRISELLSKWYLPRYSAAGVYERMAKHRTEYLLGGVWNSLSSAAPFHMRNHRLAISYSTPESSRVSNEEIVSVMEGLASALESIGVHSRAMDPKALITWIDDLTSPTTAPGSRPTCPRGWDSPRCASAPRRSVGGAGSPRRPRAPRSSPGCQEVGCSEVRGEHRAAGRGRRRPPGLPSGAADAAGEPRGRGGRGGCRRRGCAGFPRP